jgi:hypothetical protein
MRASRPALRRGPRRTKSRRWGDTRRIGERAAMFLEQWLPLFVLGEREL